MRAGPHNIAADQQKQPAELHEQSTGVGGDAAAVAAAAAAVAAGALSGNIASGAGSGGRLGSEVGAMEAGGAVVKPVAELSPAQEAAMELARETRRMLESLGIAPASINNPKQLLTSGSLAEKVLEYRRREHGQKVVVGTAKITPAGMLKCLCSSCKGGREFTMSVFELHCKSNLKKPAEYLFLSGHNLSLKELVQLVQGVEVARLGNICLPLVKYQESMQALHRDVSKLSSSGNAVPASKPLLPRSAGRPAKINGPSSQPTKAPSCTPGPVGRPRVHERATSSSSDKACSSSNLLGIGHVMQGSDNLAQAQPDTVLVSCNGQEARLRLPNPPQGPNGEGAMIYFKGHWMAPSKFVEQCDPSKPAWRRSVRVSSSLEGNEVGWLRMDLWLQHLHRDTQERSNGHIGRSTQVIYQHQRHATITSGSPASQVPAMMVQSAAQTNNAAPAPASRLPTTGPVSDKSEQESDGGKLQSDGDSGAEDLAEDKAREEKRKEAKRARGIHPSSLPFPFYSYFGVTKEVGKSETQYSAKAALTNKDGKLTQILVGQFDRGVEAARARDIAIMALGAGAIPRLNFDADHYTLEAVELLLVMLCDKYPAHFMISMLPDALRNAAKLGVRDDRSSSTTHGSMEIDGRGGAKQGQLPRTDAVHQMRQPGGPTLAQLQEQQQQWQQMQQQMQQQIQQQVQQQQQPLPSRETFTMSPRQSKLEAWASESSWVERPAPSPPKPNAVALRISVLSTPRLQPSTLQPAQAAPAYSAAAQTAAAANTTRGARAGALPNSVAQAAQPGVVVTPAADTLTRPPTSPQAEGQHAPDQPVQLVSITLTPMFDSAASFLWGNRRWQNTATHEDPLDMLARMATTEEVNYKAGSSSWGGTSRVGASDALFLQPLTGPGKRGREEGGKEYKRNDAGGWDTVHSEGGDSEGDSEDGSLHKRARQGCVAGEALAPGGTAKGVPLLNASDPWHVRVAQAEQLLQRLAHEDLDVFSAALKSMAVPISH